MTVSGVLGNWERVERVVAYGLVRAGAIPVYGAGRRRQSPDCVHAADA